MAVAVENWMLLSETSEGFAGTAAVATNNQNLAERLPPNTFAEFMRPWFFSLR